MWFKNSGIVFKGVRMGCRDGSATKLDGSFRRPKLTPMSGGPALSCSSHSSGFRVSAGS